MTVFIKDLMDEVLLTEMLDGGFVRHQVHPEYPYAILNYAEKAVYEKVWNEVTLQCRGLIYHRETHEVLARPFPKFFNYGERPEDGIPSGRVDVFDKVDGSLGILYPTPDGQWAIATRGSFTSEQAIKATEMWRERFADAIEDDLCCDCTYLAEIIFPQNRIVLDYGSLEDLVLLDVLDKYTGESLFFDPDHQIDWPGGVVERFPYRTLAEALAAEPRPNAEGFVVLSEDQTRLKIKQEDYKRLHAIMTNTSSRTVWEALRNGDDLATLFATVPDEFREWVDEVAMNLEGDFHALYDQVWDEFHRLWFGMPEGWTRKDFAERAKTSDYRPEMFLLLDDKDISVLIWNRIRPERVLPFRTEGEK